MSFLHVASRRILQAPALPLRTARLIGVSDNFAFQRHWFSKKSKTPSANKTVSSSQEDAATEASPKPPSAVEQHQEWVKFQQSIAIDGFDTGQTTQVVTGGRRRKSGDQKLSENQRKILERQRLTGTGGGEYPPMRYSDEETERLLHEAYAALPVRTGKRGSRNLKRQQRRWKLVREIRQKQKLHIVEAHQRRMKARSKKAKEVKEILTTSSDIIRRDREYQWSVYQRWAANMGLTQVPSNVVKQTP